MGPVPACVRPSWVPTRNIAGGLVALIAIEDLRPCFLRVDVPVAPMPQR